MQDIVGYNFYYTVSDKLHCSAIYDSISDLIYVASHILQDNIEDFLQVNIIHICEGYCHTSNDLGLSEEVYQKLKYNDVYLNEK